jgi:hypothetical protein
MFREKITDTCMLGTKAGAYFLDRIISENSYNDDCSLLSTMRALLYDKIENGETFITSTYNRNPPNLNDFIRWISRNESNWEETQHLFIYNYDTPFSENIPTDEIIKALPEGFHVINKITEFFKKHIEVYAFINERTKSVAIVCCNLNLKMYHYLQCSIVAMMPWYFDTGSIDDDRMNLVHSLREKTPEKYIDAIAKIVSTIDFRTEFIKSKLRGFELQFESNRITELENNVTDYNRRINEYSSEISSYLARISNLENELAGLYQKINSGSDDSEIMEYFLANKHLDLRSANGCRIEFVASDYLTYFDEDQAEKYIENRNSFFYSFRNSSVNKDDWHDLLKAIFIENKIRIKFCAAYTLDVSRACITGRSYFNYGADYSYHMPNPHIDKYECTGNFRQIFNECMKNRDYIRAVEQAIVSAKSLSFADTTVMSEFLNRLLGNVQISTPYGNKCLELPDGRMVDAKEAMEWLKGQEGDR